jgi:4-amino-4-deoxy-L-arabinose transferase-like glycosyltransferase
MSSSPLGSKRSVTLWASTLLACTLYLSFFPLYQGAVLSRDQARRNVAFASAPTLAAAIESYVVSRPPLYPLALRFWTDGLGAPGLMLNPMLWCAVIVWTGFFARRELSLRFAPLIPLICALTGAHYLNVRSYVSETLFVVFAAAVLTASVRYRARASPRGLAWVLVACAGAALTRYFAFFWLIPFAALAVALAPARSLLQRGARALAVPAASLAAVSPWLIHAKVRSGHWSGMPRFDTGRMVPTADLAPLELAARMAKTLYYDFCSPVVFAEYWTLDQLSLGRWHDGVWALVIVCVIAATLAGLLARRSQGVQVAAGPESRAARGLLPVFLAAFYLAVCALWSALNSDPIYTRFLFPSYPFIVLLVVSRYEALSPALTPLTRAPFRLATAIFLVSNTLRHAVFAGWIQRDWF